MLDVRQVSRIFGARRAVDGVSFTIDRPAFVGIIGRSGAGKSTLLRHVNGLIQPTAGEVLIETVAGRGYRVPAPQTGLQDVTLAEA